MVSLSDDRVQNGKAAKTLVLAAFLMLILTYYSYYHTFFEQKQSFFGIHVCLTMTMRGRRRDIASFPFENKLICAFLEQFHPPP
jgi:hypothetical protein